MDKLEKQKYVQKRLQKAALYKTNLVIGVAVQVFKQIYKGEILTITNAKEVKDFLDTQVVERDKPIVIEDLSLLSPYIQSYLLKYIEEPITPTIFLASSDNLDKVILSRFLNVVKLETKEIVNNTTTLTDYIEEIKKIQCDDNISEINIMTTCPEYLYYKSKYNQDVSLNARNYDKYIALLE